LRRVVYLIGFLIVLAMAACARSGGARKAAADPFLPGRLAAIGKELVFGTENPKLNEGGRLPIGKGQCPFCHTFLAEQRSDRCPSLIGIESLSRRRPEEPRYEKFIQQYGRTGDPVTGIKPHATTGGEYLIESLYCPNCYVPVGFGVKGSDDMLSPMLVINRDPVGLTDYEMVAVVAYLQSKDGGEDLSKITARADWEHYFGKRLAPPPQNAAPVSKKGPPLALGSDTPAQIVQKMGCFVCHRIPTVPNAKIGSLGPLLVLKSSASRRIRSPEYQKAVSEGRAHATTEREYVIESILHPEAFQVPGFPDDMAKDYNTRFTVEAFDKLVDFLLTLDEETARREGLDRLFEEKEGSLLDRS